MPLPPNTLGRLHHLDPSAGILNDLLARLENYLGTASTGYLPHTGEPVNAVKATASIGDDPPDDGVVITAATGGTWANGIDVVVAQAPDTNTAVATAAAFAGDTLTITLGTDSTGAPDATKATPEVVSAAVDAMPLFTAVYAGTTAITTAASTTFADGVNGTPANIGTTAIDGNDVWTAFTDDPTPSQAGWVKTYTPPEE